MRAGSVVNERGRATGEVRPRVDNLVGLRLSAAISEMQSKKLLHSLRGGEPIVVPRFSLCTTSLIAQRDWLTSLMSGRRSLTRATTQAFPTKQSIRLSEDGDALAHQLE